MNKRKDFTDYVYLSELDSVKTSDEDQLLGEHALFNAVVYEGKAVVLTYNQIVDSITFLHCIQDDETFQVLLKLFKNKRLLVNQHQKDMNLSRYIQINYHAETLFKSTYFSFIDKYDEEIRKTIYKGLHDSIKYGDELFLENSISEKVSEEDRHSIYQYISLILTINTYMYEYKCYVYPRPEEELEGHRMQDYLIRIEEILQKQGIEYAKLFQSFLDEHKNAGRKDTRSDYLKTLLLQKKTKKYNSVFNHFINIAYNHALEFSIPIIQRKEHLEKDVISIVKPAQFKKWIPKRECAWNDGYRMVSIAAYNYEKIGRMKWKTHLTVTPLVELTRSVLSLGLAFALMFSVELIIGMQKLWVSGTIALGITFLYSYCLDIIEAKFIEKLPEWCVTSVFKQMKNFASDCFILIARRKIRKDIEEIK